MNFFDLNKKQVGLFLFIFFSFFLVGSLNVPVLDRDEARFASASKDMIYKNEYIDITIGDEKRYKKPVGIYWAQILSNKLFGQEPYTKIIFYRLPSVVGIALSLFLIFSYFSRIYGRETGFLAIFFLTFSLITMSEVNQAKTDGLLLLFITICNIIVFQSIRTKIRFSLKCSFWVSLAIGILIKGPIILIFVFFPLAVLSLMKRKNYFINLYSFYSLVLFLLTVLPWFILISIKSNGMFWSESVGHDLLKKVATSQESHGFYPGYYSLLIFIFFWPASAFIPALISNIRMKWEKIFLSEEQSFLILGFIVPFLFYELIFTKLPHYVFPTYTFLSLLVANFLVKTRFRGLRFVLFPLILFPALFSGAFIYAILEYSSIDLTSLIIFIILIILVIALYFLNIQKKIKQIIFVAGFFQCFLYSVVTGFMVNKLEIFWISQRISNIIGDKKGNYDKIYHYGFNEPSLFFLTSQNAEMLRPSDLKLEELHNKKIIFFVISEKNKPLIEEKFNQLELIDQFKGFNYTKGKSVNINIFQNK